MSEENQAMEFQTKMWTMIKLIKEIIGTNCVYNMQLEACIKLF